MKLKTITLVLLTMLTLAACGGAAQPSFETSNQGLAPAAPAAPAAPVPEESAKDGNYGVDGGATANQQNPQQPNDRLVIKTAQMSIQVEKVREAETLVRAQVQELGGYIVQTQTYGADEYASITIVFRVPSAQFDNALNGVKGIAQKVVSQSLGGEDVTEEFVDLESRLRNLEATRTRLLDLLEKATKVEDALQVNQALTDVQGQIEQIQGRMKYLQQSAAMSTITVEMSPVPTTPIVSEEGWQPEQVFRRALRGLLEFGQGLVEILIVLLVWSPVWLIALFVWRWGWPRFRRTLDRPIRPAKVEPRAEEKQD